MHEGFTLSCPFCHAKSEYQDAPPGSTVRCEECESIFRVPAIHKRNAGGVVAGEAIRKSKKKLVLTLLVLLILAAGAGLVWRQVAKGPAEFKDPYSWLGPRFPEDSPHGTLARFLEAWKDGDQSIMLHYCRPADRLKSPTKDEATKFNDRFQATFLNSKLLSYKMANVRDLGDALEYPDVQLTAEDARTHAPLKGAMSPKVCIEDTKAAKPKWQVDLWSAAPRWD